VGPLALGPGEAELAGEGDELALVVVLAASGGVFDPAGMGQGGVEEAERQLGFNVTWSDPVDNH
jgi:hypothetical protein